VRRGQHCQVLCSAPVRGQVGGSFIRGFQRCNRWQDRSRHGEGIGEFQQPEGGGGKKGTR
jgi:hypothetical protein